MVGRGALYRTAPFSATLEAALRGSNPRHVVRGEPSKANIVVHQSTISTQCLINGDLGMHDFHIHRLKSEWKYGDGGWSLHQPSNYRYGAMEYG